MVQLRSFLLATAFLWPLAGNAQTSSSDIARLASGATFEMVTWGIDVPDVKISTQCKLAGTSVQCSGSAGGTGFKITISSKGSLSGSTLALTEDVVMVSSSGGCSITVGSHGQTQIQLGADGTLTAQWSGAMTRFSPSGTCAGVKAPANTAVTSSLAGTWRLVSTGVDPQQSPLARLLWSRLGIMEGEKARTCYDEAMGKLDEPRNSDVKERLSLAAYRHHMVDVSVDAANADDFAGNWGEALEKLKGSGTASEKAFNGLVKLLPEPLKRLYELGDKAHKLSTGINEKIMGPYLKGELFQAYIQAKASYPGYDHVNAIKEAGTMGDGWQKLTTDLAPRYPGKTSDARITAMAVALGTRYDFLIEMRAIAAKAENMKTEAWLAADADVARVRMTVLDCIAR